MVIDHLQQINYRRLGIICDTGQRIDRFPNNYTYNVDYFIIHHNPQSHSHHVILVQLLLHNQSTYGYVQWLMWSMSFGRPAILDGFLSTWVYQTLSMHGPQELGISCHIIHFLTLLIPTKTSPHQYPRWNPRFVGFMVNILHEIPSGLVKLSQKSLGVLHGLRGHSSPDPHLHEVPICPATAVLVLRPSPWVLLSSNW